MQQTKSEIDTLTTTLQEVTITSFCLYNQTKQVIYRSSFNLLFCAKSLDAALLPNKPLWKWCSFAVYLPRWFDFISISTEKQEKPKLHMFQGWCFAYLVNHIYLLANIIWDKTRQRKKCRIWFPLKYISLRRR